MRINRTCDGVKRRDFLKVGVVGGAGLSLANYLRLGEAGEIAAVPAAAFRAEGATPGVVEFFGGDEDLSGQLYVEAWQHGARDIDRRAVFLLDAARCAASAEPYSRSTHSSVRLTDARWRASASGCR